MDHKYPSDPDIRDPDVLRTVPEDLSVIDRNSAFDRMSNDWPNCDALHQRSHHLGFWLQLWSNQCQRVLKLDALIKQGASKYCA